VLEEEADPTGRREVEKHRLWSSMVGGKHLSLLKTFEPTSAVISKNAVAFLLSGSRWL
jgi:hypothetical protein